MMDLRVGIEAQIDEVFIVTAGRVRDGETIKRRESGEKPSELSKEIIGDHNGIFVYLRLDSQHMRSECPIQPCQPWEGRGIVLHNSKPFVSRAWVATYRFAANISRSRSQHLPAPS